MPGKKYELAMMISLLGGADRGEVRALDVAAMAQVVADDEFRGLRAGALARACGSGNSGTSLLPELHQLHERPHPLHRLHDRYGSSGPSTLTAKSTRGGFGRACSCRR